LELPLVLLSPLPPGPTPGPEAAFEQIVAIAPAITEDLKPIKPATTFPTSTQRVYVLYTYRGMEKGVPYVIAWYRDGDEVGSDVLLWRWGSQGTNYAYLEVGDFGPGLYELRLYIGRQLQLTTTFTVGVPIRLTPTPESSEETGS